MIGSGWQTNPYKRFPFPFSTQWQSSEDDIQVFSRGQWPVGSVSSYEKQETFSILLLTTFRLLGMNRRDTELAEDTGAAEKQGTPL